MTFKRLCLAASLTVLTATAAQAGETVEIRNFVGTINWTNGPLDADITKNKMDTSISTRGGLLIDGGIDKIDNDACKGTYAKWSWDWGKKSSEGTYGGYENLKDYPVIELTLPEDTNLVVENAVIFTLGEPNIESADLNLKHCGNLTLGNVSGALTLNSSGSADLSFESAASADLDIRGSGDVEGGDVYGAVIVSSRGSGDVDLGDIGSLTADLRGSGDLDAGDVSGDFAGGSRGSGDIEIGDIQGDIVFVARGSGDLETGDVTSQDVEIEVYGSSNIDVDGGDIEQLTVTSGGSSSISIDATVEDAKLTAKGSGDIYVDRVTGRSESRSLGSGDVEIGNRD